MRHAGIFVDFALNCLNYNIANDATQTVFRSCAGIELGAGIELSFIYGLALGGTTVADLNDFQFFGEIDGGGPIAAGFAAGATITGIPLIEFTFGVGGGFGVGASACFPNGGNTNDQTDAPEEPVP